MIYLGYLLVIAVILLALIAGAGIGHTALIASLRREGYKVEHLRDGRGKKRWRVGLIEQVEEVRQVERVRWIAPSAEAPDGSADT